MNVLYYILAKMAMKFAYATDNLLHALSTLAKRMAKDI